MDNFLDKIKSCGKNQIVILVLSGILLLIIAMPSGMEEEKEGSQSEVVVQTVPIQNKTEQMELRLQQILSHVSGIGKTEVMITCKSQGRKIVEKDREVSEGTEESGQENTSTSASQMTQKESTVYAKDTDGNESPYVTEELSPEISGVLVIAQGAGNSVIVNEITEAVMALFGVEAHKIKVMKMD